MDLSNAHGVLGMLNGVQEPDLVVDLTQVDFMDSTALSVLMEAESSAKGEVKLRVVARSQVDRLLDMTGVKSRLSIEVVSREP